MEVCVIRVLKANEVRPMSSYEAHMQEFGFRRGYWDGVLAACNLLANGSTEHNVRLWLFRELKEWKHRAHGHGNGFEFPPECPIGRSEYEATAGPNARVPLAGNGRSFVYAIGDGHGNVKLGVADDVGKRIRQLQTGNPSRLYLVAFLTLYRRCDADRIEREAHRANATERKAGEWFSLSDSCAVQALLEASIACGLEQQPVEVEDRIY